MEDVIEGKVAAIIDDKIVINRGEREDVYEDMTFAIFVLGEELYHSKTGESLGFFEIVKAKVVVIHVQEKMCTGIRIPGDIKYPGLVVEIGDCARRYEGMFPLLIFA